MTVDIDICVFACRSPINSLLVIDENMMASGDDQGVIKVSRPTCNSSKVRLNDGMCRSGIAERKHQRKPIQNTRISLQT